MASWTALEISARVSAESKAAALLQHGRSASQRSAASSLLFKKWMDHTHTAGSRGCNETAQKLVAIALGARRTGDDDDESAICVLPSSRWGCGYAIHPSMMIHPYTALAGQSERRLRN